jgi:hypothetical protein
MAVIAVVSPSAGVEDVVLRASLNAIDVRRVVLEFNRAAEEQRASDHRWTVPTAASPRSWRR